jgi:hypothetical protein
MARSQLLSLREAADRLASRGVGQRLTAVGAPPIATSTARPMKPADNVDRNLDRLFADINQTVSVEDDGTQFRGEDISKGVREETLIVQHRPTTQIFGGDGPPHHRNPAVTHQLAGLYMSNTCDGGIAGDHPAFADARESEDDDNLCHQTAKPKAMRSRTGSNLSSVSWLIDWGGPAESKDDRRRSRSPTLTTATQLSCSTEHGFRVRS